MKLTPKTLNLTGFTHAELMTAQGLSRLDEQFLSYLKKAQPEQHQILLQYRNQLTKMTPIEESEWLILLSRSLEGFIATLFSIEDPLQIAQAKTLSHNPIQAFKTYFIQKRAKKEINRLSSFAPFDELTTWLEKALQSQGLQTNDKELAIALLATSWLNDADRHHDEIEQLVQWCTHTLVSREGKIYTQGWKSVYLPERVDSDHLVATVRYDDKPTLRESCPPDQQRERDGFKLTDPRMNAREVQNEVHYCIYCHDHEGDFCSKGFPTKKGHPELGFKKNPLDVILTGCPLEEKISEAHFLKRDGYTIAALAMIMVDNPMCPATGHRICNDCMKACIYQKFEPVNIPQIETRILTDVLDLPWGVEIYDLLTRWNPLRPTQWIMKSYNGLKILIAGMGPAGFTLAHHLLMEGFSVVGFDGLKIEPLPEQFINEPIYSFDALKESLDERLMAGFGGVAEYGITVRWDKNFLKLIYLTLSRRPHFQVFGSVRFGGTITVNDAWQLGFDHFVIAVGAGLPKALPIPGSLAPGMRQANDFLMALQLGNAAKESSLTQLQIRLPAIVIGGGLTGVDTATEVQAYYITQVEKIAHRYHTLIKEINTDDVRSQFDAASLEILDEYLAHAKAIAFERQLAQTENRTPEFIKLIREWGGVTIAYRRSMKESPAYINNHEELKKALEEGILYAEGLEPLSADLNHHGHVNALRCKVRKENENKEWISTDEIVQLPAKSILVATGTQPNTAYEFEHRGTFNRINLEYQHYEIEDGELVAAQGTTHCKESHFGAFTSYQLNDKRVTLIGDTHPVFHGNVVKAIASGLKTYPKILALLKDKMTFNHESDHHAFAKEIKRVFSSHIQSVKSLTDNIIELTIHSPLATKQYQPGQFYRLQNFETDALKVNNTLLLMEPLTIIPAHCDVNAETLTFIIPERSPASRLCKTLKLGQRVSLMGPTGAKVKIPTNRETFLFIGDQSSFSFVRSVGSALKAAGNHVLFIAFLNDASECYDMNALQAVTHSIAWVVKKGHAIQSTRSEDSSFVTTDLLSAIHDYHTQLSQKENATTIRLADTDRAYVIGDSQLLRLIQKERNHQLKILLPKHPPFQGSVYGNMQCMLKGVCAQCLQWQIDPETGHRTKAVFACSWQDQPLEIIDFGHMDERAMQNAMQEKLTHLWLDHIMQKDNNFSLLL